MLVPKEKKKIRNFKKFENTNFLESKKIKHKYITHNIDDFKLTKYLQMLFYGKYNDVNKMYTLYFIVFR